MSDSNNLQWWYLIKNVCAIWTCEIKNKVEEQKNFVAGLFSYLLEVDMELNKICKDFLSQQYFKLSQN